MDGVLEELNLKSFQWTLGPVICICSHQNIFKDFYIFISTGVQVNLVIWTSTTIFFCLAFS